MTPRDLLDFHSDLMKLLISPGKHRYRTVVPRSPSSGDSASCSLCRVGEVGLRRGKCRNCMDVRSTSTTSYHLCLLLLQSPSLQNPMFCRLPQELKFLIIISFIFNFVISSPPISLYSNLKNYAHFCQLCSSFCRDEWL